MLKPISKHSLLEIFKFVIILAICAWLFIRGGQKLEYNWQWYRIPDYLFTIENGTLVPGILLQGLGITLQITGLSLLCSFFFGLTCALLRLSRSFIGRLLAHFYLEVIRNTPLLIQIFFIYFVLGPILGLGRFPAAILALSLFEGAYASEIFRAGLKSISKGQWEAAYSLGLSTFDTYKKVIIPQAIRYVLPPLTNQAVCLIKDSALVSTIAIYDLTMQGQAIIARTFLTFEVWFTIAVIYLLLTTTLSAVAALLEKRLQVG